MRIRTCIAARNRAETRRSSVSMKTATTLGYYRVCLKAATLPWSDPAVHTTRVRRPNGKSQCTASISKD